MDRPPLLGLAGVIPVFVPYTFTHPPTFAALLVTGWEFHPVELEAGDDFAYLRFFEYRWKVGAGFIVCEHDVIPVREQLEQLECCGEDWCSFNEYDGGPPTLSLARFRPGFIARTPGVWPELRAAHRVSVFQPLWSKLDSWLVERCGMPHIHESPHVVNSRPMGSLH